MIEVLEHVTGRPLIWATAQYLEFARPSDVVELEVTEVVRGHATSQARVLARVDGREIFTVVGAAGRRELPWAGEWAVRPDVPGPDASRPRDLAPRFTGTIAETLKMRMALGRELDELDGNPTDDGRSALWVALPFGNRATAAALAIVADYVPFGVGQALGRQISGNSIDNTLRMVQPGQTVRRPGGFADPAPAGDGACGVDQGGWILADVRVQAVAHGFGHGVVHLWAEDGTLLATASQSVIVRELATGPEEKT